MKFVNETPYPAELFRNELDPEWMNTSLVVRVRHRLLPDGRLEPPTGDDVLVDIRRDRVEDEYGIIEPDVSFPRVATDVIVLADACTHSGPVVATKVKIAVGPYDQELLVVGDRVWERGLGGGLSASRPQPFDRMPLTWSRAFGGRATSEYGEIPFAANPVGKGYYIDAASAAGNPLPNIENPAHAVGSWDHRPDPVGPGPYPAEWFLRQSKVVEIDETRGEMRIHPENGMFDRAHPRFSGQWVKAGDPIEITNTAFAPKLRLTVPACPVAMELSLGEQSWLRALELEELLLDLRKGLFDLTYRKLCKYQFIAHQKRCTTLRPIGELRA